MSHVRRRRDKKTKNLLVSGLSRSLNGRLASSMATESPLTTYLTILGTVMVVRRDRGATATASLDVWVSAAQSVLAPTIEKVSVVVISLQVCYVENKLLFVIRCLP